MSKAPKIAEAVGSASAGEGGLGRRVQDAMDAAIQQAYKDGLADDPDAIRKRMQEAREKVKAQAAKTG